MIKALLNITDSRFQTPLLNKAKKYGKIDADYQIPSSYKNNYPKAITDYLNTSYGKALYRRYPFGTDLTKAEVEIEMALKYLKTLSFSQRIMIICMGFFIKSELYDHLLKRMSLDHPRNIKEFIYRCILKGCFSLK